nr:MAG TPA: hypothetical protein [Caudoviricetes sp.]
MLSTANLAYYHSTCTKKKAEVMSNLLAAYE